MANHCSCVPDDQSLANSTNSSVWEEGAVSQDMKDANIITIWKNKEDRGNCKNCHSIFILCMVSKSLLTWC